MADAFEATATWQDGLCFLGATGSGHAVPMASSADPAEATVGPTPMELVLTALAGCTGMDVISILQKMRQRVTGYAVRVHGERASEHPRVYTAITVEHIVHGHDLVEASVARAVELSATRYCPVSAMLGASAAVRHTHRIVEADLSPREGS